MDDIYEEYRQQKIEQDDQALDGQINPCEFWFTEIFSEYEEELVNTLSMGADEAAWRKQIANHKAKNRKTNQRRNELRKQNGKPLRRWSKGDRRNMCSKRDQDHSYYKEVTEAREKLERDIDYLLDTGNIIEVFKLYGIELKEQYLSYKWLCPFHKETTPSLSISKSLYFCMCYGCWKRANLWKFIFNLEFWENVQSKLKKIQHLQQKIAPFLELPPINHFDKKGNPTERAYVHNKESVLDSKEINQNKLKIDIEEMITQINQLSNDKNVFGKFEVIEMNPSLLWIFCGKNCLFQISSETMDKLDLWTLSDVIVRDLYQKVERAKRNIKTFLEYKKDNTPSF